MRLTLIIHSLGIGGAEKILSLLANQWVELGHQVTILTFTSGEKPPTQSLSSKITVVPLGVSLQEKSLLGKIFSLPTVLSKLSAAVIGSNPEGIISFGEESNMLTLAALRGVPIATIVSERCHQTQSPLMQLGLPAWVKSWLGRLKVKLYRQAKAVVIQTEGARESFPSFLAKQLSTIPNPIVAPTTPPPHTRPHCIISIGRMVAEKRFEVLIDSFHSIAADFPDWKMILFGDGPLRPELTQKVSDLDLSERILLPGAVKDSADALGFGSIFVLSSEFEGFPNALCEAMAFGLPVIATDCQYGPTEIITDERNGILVPINDAPAIAAALARLMKEPERRVAMGLEAARITAHYQIASIAQRWIALFLTQRTD